MLRSLSPVPSSASKAFSGRSSETEEYTDRQQKIGRPRRTQSRATRSVKAFQSSESPAKASAQSELSIESMYSPRPSTQTSIESVYSPLESVYSPSTQTSDSDDLQNTAESLGLEFYPTRRTVRRPLQKLKPPTQTQSDKDIEEYVFTSAAADSNPESAFSESLPRLSMFSREEVQMPAEISFILFITAVLTSPVIISYWAHHCIQRLG